MSISYPSGVEPASVWPGDFILCRASTTKLKAGDTTRMGQLIQAGERRRFGNTDFARWTHSALIVNGDGVLIEALENGVAKTKLSKYLNTDYVVVHTGATEQQRELACQFARRLVGDHYGILNFVGLTLQSLLGWRLSMLVENEFTCSGLVARATEKYIAGYPRSAEDMMPADLAAFWGAQSGEPLVQLGLFARFLDLLGGLGNRTWRGLA